MEARRFALEVRRAAIKAVRAYFQVEGFLEVETPALQVSPGIERHIQSFATTLQEPHSDTSVPRFLHTSPELAMKKLLAGGLEKIVQLCPVYRDGERTPLHHPAFTMLEWYRTGADYGAIMDDAQAVLRAVAKAAHRAIESDGFLHWHGQVCDPALPAVRLAVQEAFARYAGIDLLATIDDSSVFMPPADKLKAAAQAAGVAVSMNDSWEDTFFRVMLERIEPQLGIGAPTILYEYPVCLGALARRKPGDSRVAERFELYACGVELANAYSELTDVDEQRARFAHDRAIYESLYGDAPPVDEDFLAALAQVPPCAGAALGFDRLVMLAAGADDITQVLWAQVE
ncbi:MAG: EF-P lysine aminoacylase GenX [Rhodospirillaceae bacterium]|nr:MAG: EF-P lysine aminoacylase GenX [Rhodospirillaceae bacterium]